MLFNIKIFRQKYFRNSFAAAAKQIAEKAGILPAHEWKKNKLSYLEND